MSLETIVCCAFKAQPTTPPSRKRSAGALAQATDPGPGSSEKQKGPPREAEAASKEKKRKKAYDVVAAQNKIVQQINDQLAKQSNDGLRTAIKQGNESMSQLQQQVTDGQEMKFFEAYVNTIKNRLLLAEHVVAGGDESEAALQAVIAKYKNDKVVVMDDVEQLRPLTKEAERLMGVVREAEDEDAIKLAVKGVKDSVGLYKRLQAALSRSTSDLQKALQQKSKKAASQIEKQKKAQASQQKKAEKEIQKQIKQAKGQQEANLPCLLMDAKIVQDLVADIPVFSDLPALQTALKPGGCLHSGGVYLVKNATAVKKELDACSNVRGFVQIFETQFPMSRQAKERQRAQSGMKIEGVAKIREAMLTYCSSTCTAFGESSPNRDLNELNVYGFTPTMQYSGAEYQGVANLRYSIKGEREIVVCMASDFWSILQDHNYKRGRLSAERPVTTVLGEALWGSRIEDDWVSSLLQKGKDGGSNSKIFFRAVIPEDSVLFCPAGCVLCERSINNKLSVGIRLAVKDPSAKAVESLKTLLNVHKTYSTIGQTEEDKLTKRWTDAVDV